MTGLARRHRALARLDAADADADVVDRHEVEPRSYDCGERCGMCVPDWRDRDQLRQRLARELPPLTIAERLLDQVGIRVVLDR